MGAIYDWKNDKDLAVEEKLVTIDIPRSHLAQSTTVGRRNNDAHIARFGKLLGRRKKRRRRSGQAL